MLANAFCAFRRSRLDWAASTSAARARASAVFSSAVCCETAADARNEFHRSAVTFASARLAFALASSLPATAMLWSSSGVSITASTSPCRT